MRTTTRWAITSVVAASGLLTCAARTATAQQPGRENSIVVNAAGMLQSMLSDRQFGIPPAILRQSQGVILFPNMLQLGFIGGARHGRGIVLMRDTESGEWTNPFFIKLTGGNVGLQIGASSTELVLVLRDRGAIERLLLGQGKMTLGADASLAAGPAGAGVGGETDPRFRADILTYSRGRGLYAGAVVGGSVATVDHRANWAYYDASVTPAEILADSNPEMTEPRSAAQLRQVLSLASNGPSSRKPPGSTEPDTGEIPPDAQETIIIENEPSSTLFP